MNPKLIPWLQRIFWILGWSVLVLAMVNIAAEAYYFFRPTSNDLIQWPKHEFYFLKQMRILFSSLGQAFFAFLVSSIFDMIFHRAPVRRQQTESFLIITCIGFVGEGLLGSISWAQSVLYIFPTFAKSTGPDLLSALSYLLSLFPNLISFVYAITIYVLFRHFSQMVTFESEVV